MSQYWQVNLYESREGLPVNLVRDIAQRHELGESDLSVEAYRDHPPTLLENHRGHFHGELLK